MAITPQKLQEYQEAAAKDQQLQSVKSYIKNGWPNERKNVIDLAKPYFNFREELTETDNVFLRGERIIIPKEKRGEVLRLLHESHIGIESTLRRARDTVFWPGMTAEIRDVLSKCETCTSYPRKQAKESLQPHSVPMKPWMKVGTDIFHYGCNNFIVLVDYFSNYVEIQQLSSLRSNDVIECMKQVFARLGIP